MEPTTMQSGITTPGKDDKDKISVHSKISKVSKVSKVSARGPRRITSTSPDNLINAGETSKKLGKKTKELGKVSF